MALALAAIAPAAHAADVEITTAAGSGFVVRNSTASILMQVQSAGAVAIPGLPSAAQVNTLLCFDSASGTLGPCLSSAIPAGPPGPPGPPGPKGEKGDPGTPAPGTILPLASGRAVTATTSIVGTEDGVALVGFGNSVDPVFLSLGALDLTGGIGFSLNYAFTMPRDGVVTAVSGTFSSSLALPLVGTTVTPLLSLYCATASSNLFSPLLGASAVMTPLTGIVPLGTVATGITTGLAIPVAAQQRCVAVFSVTSTGISLINVVSGYVSGGVVIQ